MNIHEYQAKQLLAKYGVAVPRGGVAFTVEEAATQAQELGGPVYVVKSQIHAGGRGAGHFKGTSDGRGGVRVVNSVEEVRENVRKMLGHVLVTRQTGKAGKEVKRVYIEEGCEIVRELYLGMLLDRETSRLTMMASTEGGMEIEEVATKTPEKILKVAVDPATGMLSYHARKLAFGLGLKDDQVKSAVKFMLAIYKAFTELDCSIVEINPLVVTGSGDVIALDAKVNFDDNALYRHHDVADMRDEDEIDHLFSTRSLKPILFFSDKGKVYSQKAYRIPAARRTDKGVSLHNILPLEAKERITAAVPVPNFDDAEFCTMVTRNGKIKRVALSEFKSVRPSGLIAIGLGPDDELGWVHLTVDKQHIIIIIIT